MIAAYCSGFGMQSSIFRFVSVLGERYTHGHIVDFCRQLRDDPHKLRVLGNGRQRKSYLYVQDCIDAMLLAVAKSTEQVAIFNLGTDAYCEVNESIEWICKALGVQPSLEFFRRRARWTGDNPFIFLDTAKIRALGWRPKLTIQESVVTQSTFYAQIRGVVRAMKICVAGLWHLGSVTAACLASLGHRVIAFDFDAFVIVNLNKGRASGSEPGLDGLIAAGMSADR